MTGKEKNNQTPLLISAVEWLKKTYTIDKKKPQHR